MKGKIRSLLLLLMTAIFTIGMPSCDGPDYAAFRGIRTADFFDFATNTILSSPVTISSDSMAILIEPQIDFFTQATFRGTMDQAWAFSPPDPIMANELTDIRITSDKDMYGIPAGQNLSGTLTFGIDQNLKLSLEQFLADFLKKGTEFYYSGVVLVFFDSKPPPDTYQFVIELEDNNGHVFSATTAQLGWQ